MLQNTSKNKINLLFNSSWMCPYLVPDKTHNFLLASTMNWRIKILPITRMQFILAYIICKLINKDMPSLTTLIYFTKQLL